MQAHLRPAKVDEELEKLNKHLAIFNIEVKPKEISAPTKFHSDAAALINHISGIDKSVSGITWAPALVHFGAVGLSAEAVGVSITPSLLAVSSALAQVQIQGRYPFSLLVQLIPLPKTSYLPPYNILESIFCQAGLPSI